MSWDNCLSCLTRDALSFASGDYVSKEHDELAFIADLRVQHGLERVYRFDIGKNTDGCPPLVQDVLRLDALPDLVAANMTEYPDNQYGLLKKQLSRKFNLPPEWFVMSAGLEPMIDHIARAVLDPCDACLIPVPNFSVFEDMSRRAGAEIHVVHLDGHHYRWNRSVTREMIDRIRRREPKLAWISNPVNPTGQFIDPADIELVSDACARSGTALVVDEAYGEYTDAPSGVRSAARLVPDHPHLMVLRTFSKMYALPGVRVGYMMCSGRELRNAVLLYRPTFPFSWVSLYMAQLALLSRSHVNRARVEVERRRSALVRGLRLIPGFETVPSDSNTLMVRHQWLTAAQLHAALARRGMLTANLDNVRGIQGMRYLRLTVRCTADNDRFLAACRDIHQGICQPQPPGVESARHDEQMRAVREMS